MFPHHLPRTQYTSEDLFKYGFLTIKRTCLGPKTHLAGLGRFLTPKMHLLVPKTHLRAGTLTGLGRFGRGRWRAIDENGLVLDILLQKHRDTRVAKAFLTRLLGEFNVPEVIYTDKPQSYQAVIRALPAPEGVDHRKVISIARCNITGRLESVVIHCSSLPVWQSRALEHNFPCSQLVSIPILNIGSTSSDAMALQDNSEW